MSTNEAVLWIFVIAALVGSLLALARSKPKEAEPQKDLLESGGVSGAGRFLFLERRVQELQRVTKPLYDNPDHCRELVVRDISDELERVWHSKRGPWDLLVPTRIPDFLAEARAVYEKRHGAKGKKA